MERLLGWAKDEGVFISDAICILTETSNADNAEEDLKDDSKVCSSSERSQFEQESMLIQKDIDCNQELFKIPHHVLLHAKSPGKWFDYLFKESDEKIRNAYCSLPERDKVTVRLLLEFLDDESHWRAYIDALPSTCPCLSSWDRHSLVELKFTPIWKSTKGFQSNLDIFGDPNPTLIKFVNELAVVTSSINKEGLSFKNLQWAHQMVLSRAFGVDFGSVGEKVPTLVPVIDLLDHSNDAKVSWNISESKHFCFQTNQLIKLKAKMRTNYGAKGNEELLRGYGFTLMNNPFDFYVIELGIGHSGMAEDETLWSSRIDMLHKMGCKKTHSLTMKDPLPATLIDSTIACIIPQKHIYSFHTQGDEKLISKPHFRFKALKMLYSQIKSALLKMAEVSTIENDEELMRTKLDNMRLLMAVYYRIGLKKILKASLVKLKQHMGALIRDWMPLSHGKLESNAVKYSALGGCKIMNGITFTGPCSVKKEELCTYGLYTQHEIRENDCLLQIPMDCVLSSEMITPAMIRSIAHLQNALFERYANVLDYVSILDLKLAYVVATEYRKGKASQWDGYIQELANFMSACHLTAKSTVLFGFLKDTLFARALQIEESYDLWKEVRNCCIMFFENDHKDDHLDAPRKSISL